ncbi:hypothetical protein An02g02800 [Aspergillus niger]|uniref:Uncharacterized protein n=2 Tax=Aspergillus niger TaxID=5061 RepID=A2QCA0_ASPNC|nr:hypothetical protein An02g02800 [Aspergillus niger]CAK47564.1 hypothetical protein An02g02800 [Aspergillus niger]
MPRIQAKGINERPHSRHTPAAINHRCIERREPYFSGLGLCSMGVAHATISEPVSVHCVNECSASIRFYVRRNRPETRSALVGLAEKEGIGNILLSTYACRSFQVSNRNLVALRGMLVLEDGVGGLVRAPKMTREIILKENISIPASNNQKWLYSSRGSQEEQEERNNEPVI